MPLDLYYLPASSPCRAVILTGRALGLDLNLKLLDLFKGENMTPEYLKLNPQHTIPTLVDNGFSLWESRAIMTYLVDQYGKDDSLYPKDPKQRAVVDQRLYFDIGTLYQRFSDYHYPVLFGGQEYDPAKLEKVKAGVKFLDTFLEGQDFVAGKSLTVADLAILATYATYDVTGFDFSPYPNVTAWYARAKALVPGHDDVNIKGAQEFAKFLKK